MNRRANIEVTALLMTFLNSSLPFCGDLTHSPHAQQMLNTHKSSSLPAFGLELTLTIPQNSKNHDIQRYCFQGMHVPARLPSMFESITGEVSETPSVVCCFCISNAKVFCDCGSCPYCPKIPRSGLACDISFPV